MNKLLGLMTSLWVLSVVATAQSQSVDSILNLPTSGEKAQAVDLRLPALEPMPAVKLGGGAVLTLAQVLEAVDSSYPPLAQGVRKVRAAKGKLTSARGAFDLKLKAKGLATPFGYYDYGRMDVTLEQPTPVLGATVMAGYRVGLGFFPVYYGAYETLDAGELRLGLRVPLLQNRSTDNNRTNLRLAKFMLEEEQRKLDAKVLKAQSMIAKAYWKWVAAGLKFGVAQELLLLAEVRDEQLQGLVKSGALPAVDLLENRRAILARRAQVVSAQRTMEKAALKLSLYWRNEGAEPVLPKPSQLPSRIELLPALPSMKAHDFVEHALSRRPEVAAARLKLAQAETKLELAENSLSPRLDVEVVGARDLGSGSKTLKKTLAPWVMETGLVFELPLQQRKARGKRQEALSMCESQRIEVGWVQDQVRNEVQNLLSARKVAWRKANLTAEGLRVSREVVIAERRRLDLGSTDLIKLNLVEQYAFTAASKYIDALGHLHSTDASLRSAAAFLLFETF